ncbi:MAG TPA: putative toxin-antitoxin system toxin component, PIN family [Ardenticatenaceae bacterium]|jgi:putative PIN family toxin of toxin-antitoxin system
MPVVLIDTNVWVSAFINPYGYPARIVKAWNDGAFQVVVSQALLEELVDVLSRPRIRDKYGLNADEVTEFLKILAARAIRVLTTGELSVCRDPDDNLILETALLGGAKYAVSRDDDIKHDQELIAAMSARGVTVLSIQQMWDRLTNNAL